MSIKIDVNKVYLTSSEFEILGFNKDLNKDPNRSVDMSWNFYSGNEIGVNAYNSFLIQYSADGYEVDRNNEKRQSLFLYGISEEWGEFQGILKRIDRGDRYFRESLLDLRLELGDLLAYSVLLMNTIELPEEANKNSKQNDDRYLPQYLPFIYVLAKAQERSISFGSHLFTNLGLDKQLRVLSRKISGTIGKLNEIYEDIELNIVNPNSELVFTSIVDCLAELIRNIAHLAAVLKCSIGHIAFDNYCKLYNRQEKGTQYGSGSNR